MKKLGVDIGSTTMKYVLLDDDGRILTSRYMRHFSRVGEIFRDLVSVLHEMLGDEKFEIAISGSAGIGFAERLGLPFVQEVFAEKIAVDRYEPGTDAVIELGGEDAKILFLTGGFEMRMNGTCAGGTGAFIDQMAALMKIDPGELDRLASEHETVYSIASRCGVFAKSDIQPLLNQGARHEDIAAGILYAVANQTVAGLSQGRVIKGNVLYLGGPLFFLPELRKTFDDVLGVSGKCPENALYYVALGAALSGTGTVTDPDSLEKLVNGASLTGEYQSTAPLFRDEDEYRGFSERHKKASEGITELDVPSPDGMFLGIDCGSTTVKCLLCDRDGNVYRPFYSSNDGDPVRLVRRYLEELYRDNPGIRIRGSAVTGYGEQIIKNAFRADAGIVETLAHYTAARKFRPDVDFILDIGGQDIKCFKIKDGLIDSLYLNEACSSGCGSFLQVFAETLGYSVSDFCSLGLYAKAPVDLGSRCTVFMNSSVKQAQKDGATVDNISAGLSISVVKNALYKVIRCADPSQLGENIVVQGGTFLNDCILRAFELETGKNVIRPKLAGLMGAYGAALYASEHEVETSSVLGPEELASFIHEKRQTVCRGCSNGCRLTVNSFGGGRRYVSGNRCSKPVTGERDGDGDPSRNLYAEKRELLAKYRSGNRDPSKKTVGIPMGLNNYELLPFWYAFFDTLGFNVLVSPDSDRELYSKGQHTIPSDTACYPAKLMHGHVVWLTEQRPDAVFYPDMSYNVDDGLGVNHFNCPVVAYYPQVIGLNVPELSDTVYISDFLSLSDRRYAEKRLSEIIPRYFPEIRKKDISAAVKAGYAELDGYRESVSAASEKIISGAKKDGRPVAVLCGRPYHADPEICHGIDGLLVRLGASVVTEDSISGRAGKIETAVRNQWTYHSRMYSAAEYVATHPDENMHVIQLVSFGCGVDAITSDEVRSILESRGAEYTQIKIDEISNTGAVSIRLRSLFAMLDEKKKTEVGKK